MAYQRLVYTKGARGQEENYAIHIRDVEQMTACTDDNILDEYGVGPEDDSCPDEHKNVSVSDVGGSVHRSVSSMFFVNNGTAFDKRFTKRAKFMIGDDMDVLMDGFYVERGGQVAK